MIAKGVRFNAEKKQVGNYYSTKVKFSDFMSSLLTTFLTFMLLRVRFMAYHSATVQSISIFPSQTYISQISLF